MIHATDLFRPHDDPDDHWDLACVYALAYEGRIDLKAVLCDFPRSGRRNDPDVAAVAQMNYLTGQAVPLIVGTSKPMRSRADVQKDVPEADRNGVRLVLRVLRESSRPVVINITGSCRTIAVAGKRAPSLFAEKCAAIYLNAGTGSRDPVKARRREYNVSLDSKSYAAIFDLPCPVYWMPCFEEFGQQQPNGGWPVRPFGTYYRFRHSDVLPHLSDRVVNFFTFMSRGGRPGKSSAHSTGWLRHLVGPRDREEETRISSTFRNMWCTGGFLHATGRTVCRDGRIVSLDQAGDEAVFTFDPVRVSCRDDGVTHWNPTTEPTNRFIFHVRDTIAYPRAMTTALRTLLARLP
ncbi:MAG: hypothetical protein GXP27_18895 [Planctomycetes bacterium]|nr:hypothetical protein [Planctomycetota bacterium]